MSDLKPTCQPPAWFTAAVAQVPEHRDVMVEGARVHLRCWGSDKDPGLLFVHGGGAHSGWWDHIAPFFAATNRVVAVDLSGHGDSGHRAVYRTEQWASEASQAASAGGIMGSPYVVGHSMGGYVAATIGAFFPSVSRGQMLIDSRLQNVSVQDSGLRRPLKLYSSAEKIAQRFALTPPQDVLLDYVRNHIVSQSIRKIDQSWVWKFDGEVLRKHSTSGVFGLDKLLPRLTTSTVYLRSEHGLVNNQMAYDIAALNTRFVTLVELPDAGHHPMMDQPLPLVAAIRAVTALSRDIG